MDSTPASNRWTLHLAGLLPLTWQLTSTVHPRGSCLHKQGFCQAALAGPVPPAVPFPDPFNPRLENVQRGTQCSHPADPEPCPDHCCMLIQQACPTG